ncbi:hypothetical protein R3P38DRAFT_3594331 [Favolaschia claudopus]|uniref:C2H2-type domain-containing protein n=1 Tax=Favolaschia claudopus TaxID=2862362 RepID=A0AAW0DJX1_9AGAR
MDSPRISFLRYNAKLTLNALSHVPLRTESEMAWDAEIAHPEPTMDLATNLGAHANEARISLFPGDTSKSVDDIFRDLMSWETFDAVAALEDDYMTFSPPPAPYQGPDEVAMVTDELIVTDDVYASNNPDSTLCTDTEDINDSLSGLAVDELPISPLPARARDLSPSRSGKTGPATRQAPRVRAPLTPISIPNVDPLPVVSGSSIAISPKSSPKRAAPIEETPAPTKRRAVRLFVPPAPAFVPARTIAEAIDRTRPPPPAAHLISSAYHYLLQLGCELRANNSVKCYACKQVSVLPDMGRHVLTHNRVESAVDCGIPGCNQTFSRKDGAKRHRTNQHTKEENAEWERQEKIRQAELEAESEA